MVYLDNHIITLNSTDGTLLNGTFKSNINFAFRGLLKDDVNIVRTYVTVLNAQIPVSFYVVDATNNTIAILRAPTYPGTSLSQKDKRFHKPWTPGRPDDNQTDCNYVF